MTTDRLILEYRFSTPQKIHLLFYASLVLLFNVVLITISLNTRGYLVLLFSMTLLLSIIAFNFSRKGFIKNGANLYRAHFFRDILLFRKKIDLTDKPVISILKFKKKSKISFFFGHETESGIGL